MASLREFPSKWAPQARTAAPAPKTMRMAFGGQYVKGSPDGGRVVGPGGPADDKVPAQYSNGEFVVSNAMLDKAPSLRGQLSQLRTSTLAGQGKSVASADAHAMGYDEGPQGAPYAQQKPSLRNGGPAIGNGGGRYAQGAGSAASELPDDGRHQEPQPLAAQQLGRGSSLRMSDGGGMGSVGERQLWEASPHSAVRARPSLRLADGGGFDDPAKWTTSQGAASAGGTPSATPSAYTPPPVNSSTGAYVNQGPTPTVTPVAEAPPKMTPYRAGQSLRTAWDSPAALGARRVIGAVGAISDGTSAVTNAQSGNYSGALDDGLGAAASVAGTFAGRAGSLGMAYQGGHALGTLAYNHMSPETQDSIGSAVNTGVRTAGKLFGQDWGVDAPSAQPSAAAAAAAAAPAAVPAPTLRNNDPYAAANAAKLAAAQPVTQDGMDTTPRWQNRPGQSPLFTNMPNGGLLGNDNLMNRQPMSAQNQQAFNALGDRGNAESVARVQATQPSLRNPGPDMQALAMSPLGTNGRRMAQQMMLQQTGDATMRRGQDMDYQARLIPSQMLQRQREMASQIFQNAGGDHSKAANIAYSAGFSDLGKQFQDSAAAQQTTRVQGNEARAKADDALHTQIAGLIPPTADGKPDLDTASRYAVGINADMASKKQVLQQKAQRGDSAAAAALKDLQDNGHAALDDSYKRTILKGMQAADLAGQYSTGALNPMGGKAVISDAPITSMRKTGDGFLGFGGEYTSNRGDKIPARAVEGDGSVFGSKRRLDFDNIIQK